MFKVLCKKEVLIARVSSGLYALSKLKRLGRDQLEACRQRGSEQVDEADY